MKNIAYFLGFVFTIVLLYGFAFAQDKGEAGKKLFTDAKCASCHSVESQGITLKTKKPNVPDLSGIGAKLKADFLKNYLQKKEKVKDKLHPTAFKGTDADLQKLVDWLMNVKK